MTDIKIYKCRFCHRRGEEFVGIKQDVRLHLRKEHGVRGLKKEVLGQRMPSQLTKETIVEDFE